MEINMQIEHEQEETNINNSKQRLTLDQLYLL